jgi:hypothetical protein
MLKFQKKEHESDFGDFKDEAHNPNLITDS